MKILIVVFAMIEVLACTDSRTKQITTFLKDKKGKLICFPDFFNVKNLKQDSTYSFLASKKFINYPSLRVVTSINGDCHACINQLKEWTSIIDEFPKEKVKFLFFINAENYASFELMNDSEIGFIYPVIYDYNNGYILKNEIPDDNLLNTMLIDSVGKIIIVGNPLQSKELLKLYKDAIVEK
ncbi:MAG: hypothetical protein AB2L24_32010 [Mangrovibacterium sp.]